MSRPLFLVNNCHGRFFDVTGIFEKIVTGTKKDHTGKKINIALYCLSLEEKCESSTGEGSLNSLSILYLIDEAKFGV